MSYIAEQAVIGCLIVDEEQVDIVSFLTPDMFGSPLLGRMYAEIKELHKRGVTPDFNTLRNQISADDIPTDMYVKTIAECSQAFSFSQQAKYYAEIVLGDYRADELNRLMEHTHFDRKTIAEKSQELLSSIESLSDIAQKKTENAADAVRRYSADKFTPNVIKPIKTQIQAIDKIIGGMESGNMVIIAARPSVGKSAMATQIALNLAKSGKRCEIFNLEMRNQETYDRLIANESGIELSHIKYSTQFVGEEARLFDEGNKSLESIGDRLLMVDDLNSVTEIVARAKNDKADVVVIDYAQLLRNESTYKDRTAQVGEISRSIKLAANKLQIPFIVLAQLNRLSTMAGNKKPSMSELRESGAWEQDADKIILLWNKDENDRSIKGVLVDKNRQGETGETELKFDGAVMRFVEIDDFVTVDSEGDVPFIL